MSEFYILLKWLHILSATLLFGTGLGTAFQMWRAHRSDDVRAIAVVSESTVTADWIFTAAAGVFQLVSGILLVILGGFSFLDEWILWSFLLFLVALSCWVPVAWIQIQVRRLAADARDSNQQLPDNYFNIMRIWFWLGWPAFASLVVIFYLMVAKPA